MTAFRFAVDIRDIAARETIPMTATFDLPHPPSPGDVIEAKGCMEAFTVRRVVWPVPHDPLTIAGWVELETREYQHAGQLIDDLEREGWEAR